MGEYTGRVLVYNLGDSGNEVKEREWLNEDWETVWGYVKIAVKAERTVTGKIDDIFGIRLVGQAQGSEQYRLTLPATGKSFYVNIVPGATAGEVASLLAEILRQCGIHASSGQWGDPHCVLLVARGAPFNLSGGADPGLQIYRDELRFEEECYSLLEMSAIRLAYTEGRPGVVDFFTVQAGSFDYAQAIAFPDTASNLGLANSIFFRRAHLESEDLIPSHELGHVLLNIIVDSTDRTIMNGGRYSDVALNQRNQAIRESGPQSSGPQLLEKVNSLASPSLLAGGTRLNQVRERLEVADWIDLLDKLAGTIDGDEASLVVARTTVLTARWSSLRFTALRALAELDQHAFFLFERFDVGLGLLAIGGIESDWVERVFAKYEAALAMGVRGVEDAFQARKRVLLLRKLWNEIIEDEGRMLAVLEPELWMGYDVHRNGIAFWDSARGGAPSVVWAYRTWASLGADRRQQFIGRIDTRPNDYKDFLREPRLAHVGSHLW